MYMVIDIMTSNSQAALHNFINKCIIDNVKHICLTQAQITFDAAIQQFCESKSGRCLIGQPQPQATLVGNHQPVKQQRLCQLTWSRMSKMSFPSPKALVITVAHIEFSGPVPVVIALVSPDAKSMALSTIRPQFPWPSLTMIHPTVTMSVGAVTCALHLHHQ